MIKLPKCQAAGSSTKWNCKHSSTEQTFASTVNNDFACKSFYFTYVYTVFDIYNSVFHRCQQHRPWQSCTVHLQIKGDICHGTLRCQIAVRQSRHKGKTEWKPLSITCTTLRSRPCSCFRPHSAMPGHFSLWLLNLGSDRKRPSVNRSSAIWRERHPRLNSKTPRNRIGSVPR